MFALYACTRLHIDPVFKLKEITAGRIVSPNQKESVVLGNWLVE